MKLPNFKDAVISQIKITGYLLSFSHRNGRSKAEFFVSLGFSPERWEELSMALFDHAAQNEVAKDEESPFGKRYVIEGELIGPGGRTALIRSVWFIGTGEDIPRLVTAYPSKRSGQ